MNHRFCYKRIFGHYTRAPLNNRVWGYEWTFWKDLKSFFSLNSYSRDVVFHITLKGGEQCPNVDNPCHWTQQCDDSVIGGFLCRCDPNEPSLTETGGACLDPYIWKAAGPNNLGFRAVHLAAGRMNYERAEEYCNGLAGLLPNYFTKEIEQEVNTFPISEMLVFVHFWLCVFKSQ